MSVTVWVTIRLSDTVTDTAGRFFVLPSASRTVWRTVYRPAATRLPAVLRPFQLTRQAPLPVPTLRVRTSRPVATLVIRMDTEAGS